jgi:hypothetical protein
VELMDTVLLTVTDEVEASFDVSSLVREFAILGNLDSAFIVDHEDGRYGWETLRRFTIVWCQGRAYCREACKCGR